VSQIQILGLTNWSGYEFHNITLAVPFKYVLTLACSASPRIWTCDTRPLLLAWAGWGLGTRL